MLTENVGDVLGTPPFGLQKNPFASVAHNLDIPVFGGVAMPKQPRVKTSYPGVYYIEGTSANGRSEKLYYIRYRRST